jgi:hypothetical protein
MRATLTITDLTRMKGNRICVAGVLPTMECVRPLPPRTNLIESWLFRNWPRVLKPFAVIEMELLRPAPDLTPPHTEDWEIELGYTHCYDLTPEERYELLHSLTSSHLRSVFGAELRHDGNGGNWWVTHGEGTRSLGTIHLRRVVGVIFHVSPLGKRVYRLQFTDEADDSYHLPVTDLAFRMHLDALIDREGLSTAAAARQVRQRLVAAEEVFLRVGLTRPWEAHRDRCQLQVNGIYTFPDYLDGRCFKDFIERHSVEVPF